MADIVNLRRARKARERTEAATQAANNRARFGQTRQAREQAVEDEARRNRLLDGAKRDE